MLLLCVGYADAAEHRLHFFTKQVLTDKFWSEAAAIGDIDRDGHKDIVAGPFWYEGPDFKIRHAYSPALASFSLTRKDGSKVHIEGFSGALGPGDGSDSDNTYARTQDFDHNGWTDILIVGPPSEHGKLIDRAHVVALWYENPGKAGLKGGTLWKRHLLADDVDNQSITFVDLLGQKRPVLLAMSGGRNGKTGGQAGYFASNSADPRQPWTFHPISRANDEFQWYTHGLGYGDVNADGRIDVLHSDGWWEQPESLSTGRLWRYHPYPFNLGPGQIKQSFYRSPDDPLRVTGLYEVNSEGIPRFVTIYGGSQMHVDDVSHDGLPDVITSLVAHGYGLAWWEQIQNPDKRNPPTFKRHLIIHSQESDNPYGVKFSEMQAVAWADMDADGLKDIVTGKRFWSHGKCCLDPESNAPAVLYWFRQVRKPDKRVVFIPYLIDDDSGAGTQLTIGDVNDDGRADIVAANTKGAFVFFQKTRNVSKEEWDKAQPPVLFPRTQ